MPNKLRPTYRMNIRRQKVRPVVVCLVLIKAVITKSQAITNYVNDGGHTYGEQVMLIAHFHFAANLELVVVTLRNVLKEIVGHRASTRELCEDEPLPVLMKCLDR